MRINELPQNMKNEILRGIEEKKKEVIRGFNDLRENISLEKDGLDITMKKTLKSAELLSIYGMLDVIGDHIKDESDITDCDSCEARDKCEDLHRAFNNPRPDEIQTAFFNDLEKIIGGSALGMIIKVGKRKRTDFN